MVIFLLKVKFVETSSLSLVTLFIFFIQNIDRFDANLKVKLVIPNMTWMPNLENVKLIKKSLQNCVQVDEVWFWTKKWSAGFMLNFKALN